MHSVHSTKTLINHYVPLCHQALEVLEELKDLTNDVNGNGGFILTGCYDVMKTMSESATNEALVLIIFSYLNT